MSDPNVNPEDTARRARELIEADANARVEAVRLLAVAADAADDAERRAKDAAAAHDTAWQAALRAGWSEKDLRSIGVRAAGQSGRRGRRTTTEKTPA